MAAAAASVGLTCHSPSTHCIYQILLSVGLGIRWKTDPKEKERGLALIILGSLSASYPLLNPSPIRTASQRTTSLTKSRTPHPDT